MPPRRSARMAEALRLGVGMAQRIGGVLPPLSIVHALENFPILRSPHSVWSGRGGREHLHRLDGRDRQVGQV